MSYYYINHYFYKAKNINGKHNQFIINYFFQLLNNDKN